MKYYKGRPMIDECEDYVGVYYRPRGEENWDTRHLSVWMDRFNFVSELAKWQVENRELSEDEIIGAVVAWNMSHVKEEAMLEYNMAMMNYEKAKHRAIMILENYKKDWFKSENLRNLMFTLQICIMSSGFCTNNTKKVRISILGALKNELNADNNSIKGLSRLIRQVNNNIEILFDNHITISEVKKHIGNGNSNNILDFEGDAA